MTDNWLGRLVRRLGSAGIALTAMAGFVVAFAVASLVNLSLGRRWYVDVCGAVGLAAAVGVYSLFDRFDLRPADPDPVTRLSLNGGETDRSRLERRWGGRP